MIQFISIAGLMTLASWWFVVRPLLGKPAPADEAAPVAQLKQQIAQLDALHQSGALSEEHHRESRGALEKKLAEAVVAAPPAAAPAAQRSLGLAIGLAVFMVAVVGGGYWLVGTPAALASNPAAAMAAANGNDAGAADNAGEGGAKHPMSFDKIQSMAEGLAARLKDDPNDATGWAMLARSYMVLGRYPEAVPAFKRATALVHDDAQLYADYADALAMANDRNLSGEPMALVAQALKIDPNNLKALTLAGTDAFERKDYATTIKDWEKVAQLGANDSEFVQQVRQGIAEARDLAAKAGVKVPPPAAGTAMPAAATPSAGAPAMAAAGVNGVSGRVSLSAALAKQASPDDTVFVFARAAQGPRMPLAIVRKQVKDLPFDFTLDDSTAMSPQMKLSNFQQVVVGARISKSGNAMPQPGDLQGISSTVSLGATGLKIEIGEVVK